MRKETDMERCDLVITGGGPAGLAAAVSAWEAGVRDIVVLEREIGRAHV